MIPPRPSAPPSLYRPCTLLVGFVMGLLVLMWFGREMSKHDWHHDFFRFHPLIAPESNYQPTVAEMRAIVRARCRPDQILVIIGGNSIFQGVGQPVEKLWTRHLQQLLGDRFAVVNLAFRGSGLTDGGAVVAESLRDEFPRQIYVANTLPFNGASPGGSHDYRFMVLDALHKGWLLDHPPRNAVIDDYINRSDVYPRSRELNLSARLDAWLYFRETWNWWSCTYFFTFPGPLTTNPERAFRPRNHFSDQENDFETIPTSRRFRPEVHAIEMNITKNLSAMYYLPGPDGRWEKNAFEFSQFQKIARETFPDALKARTLVVLSRNNPYYTRQMSPVEQERDELAYRDSLDVWHSLGYAAADYGNNFQPDDFGDRTHLTTRGGRKLAEQLAPEIRSLAIKLNFPIAD